jgi:hypothetical protein
MMRHAISPLSARSVSERPVSVVRGRPAPALPTRSAPVGNQQLFYAYGRLVGGRGRARGQQAAPRQRCARNDAAAATAAARLVQQAGVAHPSNGQHSEINFWPLLNETAV